MTQSIDHTSTLSFNQVNHMSTINTGVGSERFFDMGAASL